MAILRGEIRGKGRKKDQRKGSWNRGAKSPQKPGKRQRRGGKKISEGTNQRADPREGEVS